MTSAPDRSYDVLGAIEMLAPGVVIQRATLDGVAAAWAANGYQPLTRDQVIAVTGALPAYPASLRTLPDL